MTADIQATEQLNINAGLMHTRTKADWTSLNLTTPAYVNDPVVLQLYTFEGTNVITSYSDLEYLETELSLAGTYHFTPTFYGVAQTAWKWFEDKQSYVYGDLSGDAWYANVGLGLKF